jgi:hypothetical protein
MTKQTPMPVESQQTDRMLLAFADRYHACNAQVFSTAHVTYILTVCILMLNTNMWNRNVMSPVSQRQFVRNLQCFPDVFPLLSKEHVIVNYFYLYRYFANFLTEYLSVGEEKGNFGR